MGLIRVPIRALYKALYSPSKCLIRLFKGPYKALSKGPYKGLLKVIIRPSKGFLGCPSIGRIRLFIGPYKGPVRVQPARKQLVPNAGSNFRQQI